ncbi:MAG: cytochrome c biogenesis protein DipZ [Thermoleophilia bacterium]|nr:cytochrome c biogenesis protein DipZ [Thermoleophilia bacterium]
MALLILFGFIAGAATAVSPCVLPVLPVALSAGATGGHRRPIGIVAGLTVSFTFAIVALVYVIDALGLPDDLLRNLAIVVLLLFGVTLLVPALSTRFEGYLSRLTSRFQPKSGTGDGFWSGVLVGASLGLVYAPCAGPILAGVITVSASQPFTAGRLAVALSYGLGSAVVLYLLMIGGRRLIGPLSKRVPKLQAGMGAIMIVVAMLMLGQYDLKFQNRIADDLPAFLVNPTKSLEDSDSARDALVDIRDVNHSKAAQQLANGVAAAREESTPPKADLPVLGTAPEFAGNQRWFNTPGDNPLTLASLKGRVVLVDFWTYSCVNCIRTQPYLKAWDERYRDKGLTIVGVHTPEFPFEKDAGNVQDAIDRAGLKYPVAQDNDFVTWDAYANQYWPAEYFIDAEGKVRFAHFGEGDYDEKEDVIRELLAEAGRDPGAGMSGAKGETASSGLTTPESYLGSARAQNFRNGIILDGVHDFGALKEPEQDGLSYGGKWRVSPDYATSDGGQLELKFGAKKVYLVLGSPGTPRTVGVELDGKPIDPGVAGKDVKGGVVTVDGERLYELIDLPEAGDHTLTLSPESGIEGYAFTFG